MNIYRKNLNLQYERKYRRVFQLLQSPVASTTQRPTARSEILYQFFESRTILPGASGLKDNTGDPI